MFAKASSLSSSALPKDKAEPELFRTMQWAVKGISAFYSFTKGSICKIFLDFEKGVEKMGIEPLAEFAYFQHFWTVWNNAWVREAEETKSLGPHGLVGRLLADQNDWYVSTLILSRV